MYILELKLRVFVPVKNESEAQKSEEEDVQHYIQFQVVFDYEEFSFCLQIEGLSAVLAA